MGFEFGDLLVVLLLSRVEQDAVVELVEDREVCVRQLLLHRLHDHTLLQLKQMDLLLLYTQHNAGALSIFQSGYRRQRNEVQNPLIFSQILSSETFTKSESMVSITYVVKFSDSNSF